MKNTILTLASFLLISLQSTFGNIVVVQNIDDSGSGSLRQAITGANPGDTITFTTTLSGQTILLTSGQIIINKDLSIDATDLLNGITIDGNANDRIFTFGSTGINTLSGLTLTNGASQTGGAIFNDEASLTINKCTLAGNTATNGGAINSFTDSDFISTKTVILNSTFKGNTATSSGGAIRNGNGLIELIHCTITENFAPSGKGSGIGSYGDSTTQVQLNNCIISGNTNSDVDLFSGTLITSISSSGDNLVGTGNTLAAFNQPGDLINAVAHLAPLGNYGGPTFSMPPLPGSPAINAAGYSELVEDQRGFPRTAGLLPGWENDFDTGLNGATVLKDGSSSDTGSLTSYSFLLTPEETWQKASLVLPDQGNISTFSASFDYRFTAPAGTVYNPADGLSFSFGPAPLAAVGEQGITNGHVVSFNIYNSNHASDGSIEYLRTAAAPAYYISSSPFGRFSDADEWHQINITLSPEGLLDVFFNGSNVLSAIDTGYVYSPGDTFTFGARTAAGYSRQEIDNVRVDVGLPDIGAVEWNSNHDSILVNTLADEDDGLLLNDHSLREVIEFYSGFPGSTVSFAPALSGQTIILSNGHINITRSLDIDGSALTDRPSINGNDSDSIFEIERGAISLMDSLILTNGYAYSKGGAIYIGVGASFTLNNSILTGNRVFDGDGGALFNEGRLTLNNSTITNNTASYGGGIYNESSATISHSLLAGNTAESDGGGIYNDSILTIKNSAIAGNTADDGGGIYSYTMHDPAGLTTTVINCTLYNNTAREDGGGINTQDGFTDLIHCTLTGNEAQSGTGGGIACYKYDDILIQVKNSIITENLNGDVTLLGSYYTTNITSAGHNLIGTGNAVSAFNQTGDQINGVAQLVPFGIYGGSTPSMPPFPGSPAIDAGGAVVLSTDQRNYSRSSPVDIGAVEFQGSIDMGHFWPTDWDGDGNPFGLEYALGTDWYTADATNSLNFAAHPDSGVTFGYNIDAVEYTAWVVKRSLNLATDPFTEILRFDGPTETVTSTIPHLLQGDGTPVELLDLTSPPPTNAFYQFEAVLSP